MWVCSYCGHAEPLEQEVICWECGKGEMVYQVDGNPTLSSIARVASRHIRASLKDELVRKAEQLFSNWDPSKASVFAEWFSKSFRVESPKTPKGQKDLKEAAVRFLWVLRHGPTSWQDGSEKSREDAEGTWKTVLKPRLDDLVRNFSDEGGVVVPQELRIGQNTYLNLVGANEPTLKKYALAMEKVFDEIKGWRKKALSGGVKVAFASPRDFGGTASGKYKSGEDTLYIRATPAVLKRTHGTYASFDYIIVHELGHRYEYKNRVPVDFDRSEWTTSRYSMKEGESFAELFAISNFDLKGPWDQGKVDNFEKLMGN